MKKILVFLLLASAYFPSLAQTAPLNLTAVKSIITQKLTPIGSDRIDGQKMRDVTNALAEQIDLASKVLSDTLTRPPAGSTYFRKFGSNIGTLGSTGKFNFIAPSLASLSDFATCVTPSVLYDGSVWKRMAMSSTLTNVISTSALGYGAMFTAPVNGFYYARLVEGAINAKWFGARGDLVLPVGYTTWALATTAHRAPFIANQQALQNAIQYAARAVVTGPEGAYPLSKDRPNALYIPSGTYIFGGGSLYLYATLHLFGDGGQSFGGTVLRQLTDGQHLFEQKESGDYSSTAIQVEDIRLTNIGSSGDVALYYSRSFDAQHHSCYLNRVWFQGFSYAAVQMYRGGDLQVNNCVFDGGYGKGFILGSNTNMADHVTQAKFQNNTFYWCILGVGELRNVETFLFQNNTIDNLPGNTVAVSGIDALSNTFKIRNIQIQNNSFNHIAPVLATKSGEIVFTGNTINDANQPLVVFGGGGVISGGNFSDNKITGTFATEVIPGVPKAPFYAYGTGVQNSIFHGNIIQDSTATSPTAFYFPDTRTTGNDFSGNKTIGFSAPNVIANAGLNGLSASNTTYIPSGNFQVMNLKSGVYKMGSSVTGMPYVASNWLVTINHSEDPSFSGGGPYSAATAIELDNPQNVYMGGNYGGTWKPWVKLATATDIASATALLGLGTAAKKNTGDFVTANGSGVITPYYSITGISTSAMSTTAFTTVMNAGTLPLQSMYDIKLVYVGSGIDAITQSWSNVPFDASDASSTGFTDFPTTRTSYTYQFGRYFTMRYVAGGGGYGLALKLSDAILATGGTLRLDFYRK